MAIAQRLEGRQVQRPIMTEQMQASVKILQMANAELQATLTTYAEQNPFIELALEEELPPELPEQEETTPLWELTRTADATYDITWLPEDTKTLQDFLKTQIDLTFKKGSHRFLAQQMSEFLDNDGYFRCDLTQLAHQWNIQESVLQDILRQLKMMDPVGVFSQILEECLETQLKDLCLFSTLHKNLLPFLSDIFGKNAKKIMKKFSIDKETLANFVQDLRRCNPKPALGWGEKKQAIIRAPDLLVVNTKNGLSVELNGYNLPKLFLNQHYISSLKESCAHKKDKKTQQAKQYFRQKLSEARWLQRSLHQRSTTILKVAHNILQYQDVFFQEGVGGLKPLCLKQVAEDLNIHESTVSRAVSGKTVATNRGIVELKAFFITGVDNHQDEATSVATIQETMKELISSEKPEAPYSDAQLIHLLSIRGMNVARRTIAKYRKTFNIPTSYNRKHQKTRGF